jgi:hypothetical protein
MRWENICKSKKKGGLGIKNIRKMNISLLCKWWWKLEKEKGIWQEIIKAKYLQKEEVSSVRHKLIDSPVWTNLLKVKHIYLGGRMITTINGKKTMLWKDSWLSDKPICSEAYVIFEPCLAKDITIHQFLSRNGDLELSRWLPPVLFHQWVGIVDRIYNFNFKILKT